ncbi:proton channel OtopLc-like isoform X1 [Penaeus japonicus]|uniref:proton channel OtopLc-like isoform X1 n=1 Tax=Penaeus japonicus TaxID=27405 RepID=UPI001C70EC08|nr:proton channel OtopLc-like isoform X1 [Penaeus japonicus]
MRLLHWSSLARMPPKQSRCNCKHHQHQRMLAGHGARDEDELTRALQEPELEVALQLPIAYPDHPERDSLDGHLPGSSHGTGNPPPPPAPPAASGVSNKPSGSGFTKGPNAKNKKHKKLKNEADEGPPSGGDAADKDKKKDNHEKSGKDKDMETGGGYRPKTEPYTYLWVVMSGMYGKLVVLLMLAFCLTEVLDNQVLPLTFQGIFLMYLYVGSIVAIMCIYVTVIADNCPSITASKENLTKNGDPEAGSITSFGTLKRAHISRSKTSRTSFYLRVGALVFGLGTLIFNGLEIAMHSTMKGECVEDIVFAHPILQALFTFLQMHFLFVNSEVIVEKFGQVARFGFMHLVATNVAIWIRMVVWESATDSIEVMYSDMPLAEVPPHAEQVLRLYSCFQNNSLGRLWTDAQPYLFPFLVEYSLIAAAVTYIMWCNVGKEKLKKLGHLGKASPGDSATLDKRGVRKGYWKVDCRSASKGLFLGLLCLVGGIVILIMFFVMKNEDDFQDTMFWISNATQMIILGLAVISTIIGFLQIPKLSVSTSKPLDLDRLLLSTTILGVYLFAVFGMIVGGINYTDSQSLATFCVHALLLVQVSLQGMLVAEASRRTCTSRYQMLTKPGRQVITFLLFANITLWILDTFMTHTRISQHFQFSFYGTLAWGIISRISVPLLILYRFHSAVILVEIWKNTYRTKAD